MDRKPIAHSLGVFNRIRTPWPEAAEGAVTLTWRERPQKHLMAYQAPR